MLFNKLLDINLEAYIDFKNWQLSLSAIFNPSGNKIRSQNMLSDYI